ncbi:hypothetical protein [Cellulophaga sp. L1A9]|uniref:hypothetical protein n=1 Tax=Cellulophaga sp. L1A9 TaxID=2686362 RepID=UPI00131D1143|nr:hypothetical protein [Cellulophaga sp. L1A9]
MKNIFLILSVLTLLCCKAQTENVELSFEKTDAPLKIMESFIMNDSIYVTLLKPYRVKVKSNYSNDIKLSEISIGPDNDGASDLGKYLIFTDKEKLAPYPRGVKFSDFEIKTFDIYIGYKMFITNLEKNDLLKNSVFLEENRERKVYDLSKSEIAARFFEQKITDDIRGYLSFSFYNYENELGLRETIAVE